MSDIPNKELIIPKNLKFFDSYIILFRNMGWDVSVDKFGNLCFTVDENTELKNPPNSYILSCYDYRIFVDGFSYEEDSVGYIGKDTSNEYAYKIEGKVLLILQNMIHIYAREMVRKRSQFIVFPKGHNKEQMIDAIVDMFPEKYTRKMLETKIFCI